ncbi:MAG: hypothetical protein HUU54_06435 [Ignavibacteriaceae bacterium]|nr:hypothetical protein [Ignavibacteriaceae bacterium]
MPAKAATELIFEYHFRFESGLEKHFTLKVDKSSLSIIRTSLAEPPDWAKLGQFKCSHCPLDPVINKYCPVAVNLVDILDEFKDFPSYEQADVNVTTLNRSYFKHTSLQAGVSSLIGIKMVTSGCPIMGRLKPMLNFHLPFATLEETQVRALSFYLLYQYIRWKKGETPDWEMNELINIYEDIRVLNHNVSRKIANLESRDTSINSLVILNNFADYVTFTLDEKMLDELEVILKDFSRE